MGSISYQEDLTNENAERILDENGYADFNLSINNLRYRKVGHGHFELSCSIHINPIEGITLSTVTTNTQLIDEWGEEPEYFEGNSYYNSNEDVMNSAFELILWSEHNQDKLDKFLKIGIYYNS